MSKDKKKKKKKHGKDKANASIATGLKSITENPLVADVVAAALVAMASALKDSEKARKMASHAGDQLGEMTKSGADKSSAMWQLALQVGRRTLETLSSEEADRVRGKAK